MKILKICEVHMSIKDDGPWSFALGTDGVVGIGMGPAGVEVRFQFDDNVDVEFFPMHRIDHVRAAMLEEEVEEGDLNMFTNAVVH